MPTQAIVGEFLATFQEFPPRQKAASFTVDQVMEKLRAGMPQLTPMDTPPAPEMVWIPGGSFLMGSDRHYPEEAPAHRVSVGGSGSTGARSPTPSSPASSTRPGM